MKRHMECTEKAVPGKIIFKQLLGNVMRYSVDTKGAEFSVDVLNSNEQIYNEGDEVKLYFTKSEINELRA